MTFSGRNKWVIAIYLNSRGFAFVLFEEPLQLRNWDIVEATGAERKERIIARATSILAVLAANKPVTVVLQDMSPTGTHRPHRIRHFNEAIARIAERYGLPTALISRSDVRRRFAYLGSVTKDTIAAAIAKHIPDLKYFLPPPRKPWKSEDARMGLFDAAALALTFFHTDGVDSSDAVTGLRGA
jgi:hypothetical protein